jgi:hypothetical protein
MSEQTLQAVDPCDPYAGNVLVHGMGPILTTKDILRRLTVIPAMPSSIAGMPMEVRLHWLANLQSDFHIPSMIEAELALSIDLAIRQGYRYRDPRLPNAWELIAEDVQPLRRVPDVARIVAVVGISGTGKTQAVRRCLQLYPGQVIRHAQFPGYAGEVDQCLWQSLDIPSSGRTSSMGAMLMQTWDETMGSERFVDDLERAIRGQDDRPFLKWRGVAKAHFLGVLHFDEIQNLFKLETFQVRKKTKDGHVGLRLIEDQCVKYLLGLSNAQSIPLILSGTPDGLAAVGSRLANAQRFAATGTHIFQPFSGPKDRVFRERFLNHLGAFQYVKDPLPVDDDLAATLFKLTGGIQRLIVALWYSAHRVAFGRGKDCLKLEHFEIAAGTLMAPVMPAVRALLDIDVSAMRQYEDLLPKDPTFWPSLWARSAA